MILRIPVTKVYEVHVSDEGQLATPTIVREVKGEAASWSIEQIEQRGTLVQSQSGNARIVCANYPGDMPCTD
jgi:hypothetical protein